MNLYRNRTLLAVSGSVGMSMLGIGMVVPVRVLYAQSHGASLAVIGAMASAFLLSSFIFQYPVGWLADMWGKRLVMNIGLIGLAVLTLFWLTVTDPILFVALRFVEGIFASGVTSSARALLTDEIPDEQRGQAFGIYGACMNAGFLLGPALGGVLASTGYTPTFIGSAVFRLLAFALVLAFVPRGRQMHPDVRARAAAVSRRALWTLPLVGAYILFLGDNFYFGFDLTLAPLWLKHHVGASIAFIGLSYAVWALPNVLLTPYGGRIADRMRRSTLILTFGILQIPCYIAFAFVSSVAVALAVFALHGAIYAMMQPSVDANLAAFSPPNARGRAQGLYSAIGMVGAFAAANTLSALYGVNFRLPLFVMAAAFSVCVLVGGIMVRVAEGRMTDSGESVGRSGNIAAG
jgi:MFS family permease